MPTKNVVKVNVYEVISRAVEEGARYGWHRAHKYAEGKPADEVAVEAISEAVMNALSEVLDFEVS
jgi:hypothetical protein